ncbi:MAG: helix-hairpin-helix domain-containing protein [Planctomycetota bacterium]|nr:helix-hairpin-helix domain-containing protein [Planctomycetota bacterium]
MNDSKDGRLALGSDWETNVSLAISVRNRALGMLAVASLLAVAIGSVVESRGELATTGPQLQLLQPWTVDLNEATSQELQLVPGLGPKLIDAILTRRTQRGGFDHLDDLAEIPGFKEQRIRALSRYLRIHPAASTYPISE